MDTKEAGRRGAVATNAKLTFAQRSAASKKAWRTRKAKAKNNAKS